VDRAAFDRIIQAGGFITGAREARRRPTRFSCRSATPTSRWMRRHASGAAPAWPRAPTRRHAVRAAKVSHLGLCPRASPSATRGGRPWWRRWTRRVRGVYQHGECMAGVPPRTSSMTSSAQLNRDYWKAKLAPAAGEGVHRGGLELHRGHRLLYGFGRLLQRGLARPATASPPGPSPAHSAQLASTPQYIPDSPYSPCIQAAQGRMRSCRARWLDHLDHGPPRARSGRAGLQEGDEFSAPPLRVRSTILSSVGLLRKCVTGMPRRSCRR